MRQGNGRTRWQNRKRPSICAGTASCSSLTKVTTVEGLPAFAESGMEGIAAM
ncbi:hypothetical protein [Streptomyces luteogriseus]|uniref:hypothetical protein n=1 Tax=Streptomyces luteogriseus TaxID=68233 RepID=UPI0037A51EC4